MERIKEIENRMAEIEKEIDSEDADLELLEKEVRDLKKEKETLIKEVERRREIKSEVVSGSGILLRSFETKNSEESFTVASPEYKTAWLKNIAVDERGKSLFSPMSEIEKRAFTFITTNTTEDITKGISG